MPRTGAATGDGGVAGPIGEGSFRCWRQCPGDVPELYQSRSSRCQTGLLDLGGRVMGANEAERLASEGSLEAISPEARRLARSRYTAAAWRVRDMAGRSPPARGSGAIFGPTTHLTAASC